METTWVRSVYLYAMCALAVLLVAVGAVNTVISASAVISPNLGRRDDIDRIGIGVANVADDIAELVVGLSPQDADEIREYCEDFFSDDVPQCISDSDPAAQVTPVVEGIGKVKAELESQIREHALAKLIRGVLMLIVGWLLWRYHAHHTQLYAGGLTRRRAPAAPTESPGLPTPEPSTPGQP